MFVLVVGLHCIELWLAFLEKFWKCRIYYLFIFQENYWKC